ncbi:universal stress protein [Actinokineospora sp. HUAS TT18]|uniref:universal stress protein n=1 Tax=Actinokineospora sp. HUAS TT18 TaxID=3447451 RepID=UPI003F52752B
MTTAPIAVGVDGSAAAQAALRWAVDEATRRGCGVRLVNVWSMGSVRDFLWTSRRVLRAESRALLRAAAAAAKPGPVEVDLVSVEGAVAPELVAAADGAALLVLGTRGRARSRAVIGHCVRHSEVPVAVITTDSVAAARHPAATM